MNKATEDEAEALREHRRQQRQAKQLIERLIRWTFPQAEHAQAIRVAWAVSGFNTLAVNTFAKGGVGLFAIFPWEAGLKEEEGWQLFNPVRNVAAAYLLWLRWGWKRWPLDEDPPVAELFDAGKGG